MNLFDFIRKYSTSSEEGPHCEVCYCKFNREDGFQLPDGFDLAKNVSRLPNELIAISKVSHAILKFSLINEDELEIWIYEDELIFEIAFDGVQSRFEAEANKYNFAVFCNSIVDCDYYSMLDSISNEIHQVTFYDDEDTGKKNAYIQDLKALIYFFNNTELRDQKLRQDYIKESYSVLRRIKEDSGYFKELKLVNIKEVYLCKSDDTYYVLKNDYSGAKKYFADSIEIAEDSLLSDGWKACGRVTRHDYSSVDMYQRENELLAIWEE